MQGKTFRTLALTGSIMLVLAACSGNEEPTSSAGSGGDTSHTSSPKPALSEGKFNPPIDVTVVRTSLADGQKIPKGDSLDNNVWTRSFESDLGIHLKNLWIVTPDQYEQKLNVSIVSNDLPDIIPVNPNQLKMLVEGGKVQELGDTYEKYGSKEFKEAMETAGGTALKAATFGGKLMALSTGGVSTDSSQVMWIRTDWLEKLKLPEPKSMQDVLKIMDAFVNQDPDGNGKKDTYAINLNMDPYGTYAGLLGFFNSYHAYPQIWVEDGSGKLAYGSIQPEMKQALDQLQKLYKSGAIDKEFVVYPADKSAENEMKGKVGLHYGVFSNPGWPLRNFKKENPDGQWKAFPIQSIDDKPARPAVVSASPSQFYAVKKDAKHPEALMLLLNYYIQKVADEPDKYHSYKEGDQSYNVFQFTPLRAGSPEGNQLAHEAVVEALKTKDTSKLEELEKTYYDTIVAYRNGDNEQWFRDRIFGEEGSYAVLGHYKKNNLSKVNAFYGMPTPTMIQKMQTLKDLEVQMITKIIMGASLDEFDQFVENWKKLGGDQITEEVNEWNKQK